MYRDSYIILKAKYDVIGAPDYRHTVVIDASNDIRPNCGVDRNSPYPRPSRIHPSRNAISAVAASMDYPRRGRGVAATRLRGGRPRKITEAASKSPSQRDEARVG